jgi:prophage DNA circulation protein
MKPLNHAERTNAFLKFLLFFVITVVFIIIAVFFGTRIPLEENKKLKQQITAYEKQQLFAAKFSASMSNVQPLFDTLGKSVDQTEAVYNDITNKLRDLQTQKDTVATGNDNIYAKTMRALYDLQAAKYRNAKSGTQSQEYDRLQQDNDNLRTRINDANAFLRTLSQQGIQAPQF